MPVSERVVAILLDWFARNARDLPWRRTTDPYGIWIAEVMLQQTQVRTVIPYWERWMQALPNCKSLARSRLDRVLKLWEGLGYYRRAQHLRQAAQVVEKQHGGKFPDQFAAVLALPGIGPYTAGAICSIAFDQPTPILDGNVTRVLARVYAISGLVRSKIVAARLWARSRELVELAERNYPKQLRPCGTLNQALMEMGATICVPGQPRCPECPLQDVCAAYRAGRVHQMPDLGKRPQSENRRFVALVGCAEGKVAVCKRPIGAVNAHLWEFPNIELTGKTAGKRNGPRLSAGQVRELATRRHGWQAVAIQPLCTIRHTITRFRIEVTAYLLQLSKPLMQNGSGIQWRNLAELDKLAWPSAHRRILAALRENRTALSDGNYSRARRIQNRSPREPDRVQKSL